MKKPSSKNPRGRESKYGKGIKTCTVSARVPVQMKRRAKGYMSDMCTTLYNDLLKEAK